MKCEACGCTDRWTEASFISTTPDEYLRFEVCECGHEQECFE